MESELSFEYKCKVFGDKTTKILTSVKVECPAGILNWFYLTFCPLYGVKSRKQIIGKF